MKEEPRPRARRHVFPSPTSHLPIPNLASAGCSACPGPGAVATAPVSPRPLWDGSRECCGWEGWKWESGARRSQCLRAFHTRRDPPSHTPQYPEYAPHLQFPQERSSSSHSLRIPSVSYLHRPSLPPPLAPASLTLPLIPSRGLSSPQAKNWEMDTSSGGHI